VSEFTDQYVDLLIKQYWQQTKAPAEIEAWATPWDGVYQFTRDFIDAFDVDLAVGDQLDTIGAIVGLSRVAPLVIPKIAFGFEGNPNARGFDDKFGSVVNTAPFANRFEPAATSLQLSDAQYRFLIKAKIAVNTASAFIASDDGNSIQDVISFLFDGRAYVTDNFDMSLTLSLPFDVDLTILNVILRLGLLPKPQGVDYAVILRAEPGETFGFGANPDALSWGDRFDSTVEAGVFAQKVIL